MFADPQTVTVSGTAISLPRVGVQNPERRGSFQNPEGSYVFEVRQDQTKVRNRREVRLTMKKVAVNPLTTLNQEVSASVIIAFDEPKIGFSDSELGAMSNALTSWFTAGNRDKLLGGEL